MLPCQTKDLKLLGAKNYSYQMKANVSLLVLGTGADEVWLVGALKHIHLMDISKSLSWCSGLAEVAAAPWLHMDLMMQPRFGVLLCKQSAKLHHSPALSERVRCACLQISQDYQVPMRNLPTDNKPEIRDSEVEMVGSCVCMCACVRACVHAQGAASVCVCVCVCVCVSSEFV